MECFDIIETFHGSPSLCQGNVHGLHSSALQKEKTPSKKQKVNLWMDNPLLFCQQPPKFLHFLPECPSNFASIIVSMLLGVSMGDIGSNISSHLVILFKNHTNSYLSQAFSFTYSSSPYESQQRLSGTKARNGWEESVATSGSSGLMALEVVMKLEELLKHRVSGSLWKMN